MNHVHWLVWLAAVPAWFVTWLSIPVIRSLSRRSGLVSVPSCDRFSPHATPLGGGVAIWFGVVFPFGLATALLLSWKEGLLQFLSRTAPSDVNDLVAQHIPGIISQLPELWSLLGLGTVLMLMGLADDRWSIRWQAKLVVLATVAAVAVAVGWRLSLFLDFPPVTWLLSGLWIFGLTNSFNLLDNMDGLSAGVAAISSAMLAAVVMLAPNPTSAEPQLFLAGLLAVLIGALVGFLVYNFHPASIFMGDAGSYFVGFLLAVISLLATYAGGNLPRHAVITPLCIFAVPIYDSLSVIVLRLRAGESPFAGDTRHFSHRLVQLGLTTRQAVGTIYLLTATCGLGALLLHQLNWLGAVVVLGMITCIFIVVAILEIAARRSLVE